MRGQTRFFVVQVDHPVSTVEGFEELYLGAWAKDIKIYLVDKYKVAGIKINRIYLIFYKDRLVHIGAENSNALAEAILTKYGQPDEKKFEILPDIFPTVHWSNQDIRTTMTKNKLTIEVDGSRPFIHLLDKAGYNEESLNDKNSPKNKLKDL